MERDEEKGGGGGGGRGEEDGISVGSLCCICLRIENTYHSTVYNKGNSPETIHRSLTYSPA